MLEPNQKPYINTGHDIAPLTITCHTEASKKNYDKAYWGSRKKQHITITFKTYDNIHDNIYDNIHDNIYDNIHEKKHLR